MDINVNASHNVELKQSESIEKRFTGLDSNSDAKYSHSNDTSEISANSVTQTSSPTQTLAHVEEMDSIHNIHKNSSNMEFDVAASNDTSPTADEEDEEEDGEEMEEGAEYIVNRSGSDNNNGVMDSMIQNMGHSFDDIQFFPSSHHRSLRLQPQFQFHQDQLNDPNFHLASNLSCFDASGLVSLSGSGSAGNFSLISDSVNGDINNAFSESPFVFPDNVMEYGEPQFFPGNCVGYLETILEEDDEEYEEEEGCSGRHWWTADSDTDTDSVIRVDNNGQAQQQQKSTSLQGTQGNSGTTTSGEKDVVKPHFRSSASSKPFELEDLHLFDQLDHAFEETLREPRKRPLAYGHQSQSVEQPVEFNKGKQLLHQNEILSLNASAITAGQTSNGAKCQKTGGSTNSDKTATSHHVFIESTNNESKDEMTTKGLKMLTQENVKAHSDENSKIIYEVGEEKEQSSKKLVNAESRETFGSSLSPSSSDSEAPAEVAEEDFFYSSPGSEEEECRSQEETESEESCSSDDSEKNGVVLAEFSLGSASNSGGGNGGFNASTGMFGSTRNRRSFESPSRLKSFRSFDSLNCLAGTELLFSKPDTFPSIHHIKEVSEPGSESESSNEVSVVDDRGLIPEEDEEAEEENAIAHREGTQSLPSQHSNSSVGFPGPSLIQISNKNSASSSTSTVSSSASGSGLRSTENLSEDSGIGNDGISSTAASTPGAFIEETNVIMSNNGKQNEDCNKKSSVSPSTTTATTTANATAAELDASSLAPDNARDYISRAEFALNPFVYSSLSSSEPESSISSAPSLGCNTNSGVSTQLPRSHPKVELGNSSSFKRNDDESLAENGNHIAEGKSGNSRENSIRENHSESNGKTHEFVLDSNSIEKAELNQEQAQNCETNERIGMKNGEEELSESNANKIKASQSPSDAPNSSSIMVFSHKPTLQPSKTGDFVGKHADSVSGTESFSESGESTHVPNFNIMTNDIIPLESTSLHPQLNPPVQTISSLQSISPKSHSTTLAGPATLDCSQDKEELVNNNSTSTQSVGQPSANSPPAAQKCVPNVTLQCAFADELANTSSPTPTEQSLDTTINSCFASDNAATMNKIKSVESSHVANTLEKQGDSPTGNSVQMCNMNIMMDGSTSSMNKVKQNEYHPQVDNVISLATSTTSSMASLQPHTTTQHQSQPDDTSEEEMLCISSFPCYKPSSRPQDHEENDECLNDSNSITTEDSSCSQSQGLALSTSRVDWNEERKHAPLQLSSSLLSSAVDNFFSTCSQEQDHQIHDYSSSSSSDELNENPHQPRFHRQRSDSESEYEAAESAVERNNVDMAYDIIVNSPSKKGLAQTSSSPESSSSISSMSGVVGAMAVAASPSTTSSFNANTAKPSSLELEQPSSGTTAAAPPVEYHSQSQNEMNANKCNRESGPVSTLSSLINIHHNDMHTTCKQEDNIRNDKRLPVFESSIDDYDDEDADDTALVATALPITKKIQATSNVIHANNVIASTSVTLCAHKSFSSCTTRHEDGLVNGKQLLQSPKEQTSSTSSSPLLHQAEARVIENTSLALHHQLNHHHQQNKQQHNQQNENSDELTSASLPQSHFHVASNSHSLDAEHRQPIVGNKNKNFSGNGETQQKHQHVRTQDQHIINALRSVTLDDSTSADVAHNNLHPNQTQKHIANNTSTFTGIALKSNNTNSVPHENHSAPSFQQQYNVPTETHYYSNSECNTAPSIGSQQGSLSVTENSRVNQHEKGSNKLVTVDPYCPNQIGVAEVKKFLTGYVGPKECESFSGPVEPPSSSSSSSSSCDVKESQENNNNKQEGEEAEYCNSQSVNRIAHQTASTAKAPTTATQVNTTGKERVILGDSNFGFFGCSSHTRTPATNVSNSRGVYESHESVVPTAYASSSNVLPQVNLDLHSISASESGISPGYGFPCSLPIKGKDNIHSQAVLQEQPILKENNTLVPSSIQTSSTNSIKRSVSPSSAKAAHEFSKDVSKAAIRRDQQQSKDHKQQQQYQQQKHNQQHLHLEDIGLYAGIDKFSVPLGAIKAAVVAVAPTIPSYIVGPSNTHTNALTAEKSASKRQNSSAQVSGAQHTFEGNGNLSTAIATTGSSGGSRIFTKRGENKETLLPDKATQPASVPDILILKQLGCMRSDSETQVERKLAKRGVMELETATNRSAGNSNNSGSSDISGKGISTATTHNTQRIDSSNIESISSTEMLRSNSPAGSSAPSGIPLKSKTYGPRNEVEIVVVSSRTPSPAPGGFVSTSSSSSSRKLPSSPSSGQERNEQSIGASSSSSSTAQHYHHGQAVELYENAVRESSIPPPPSTPPVATSTKATRSRVHFSPVVSEISWRESYIDQSSEYSGSTDDLLAKLENLDAEESPAVTSRTLVDNGNGSSASANLRKAGAAAAAAAVATSATSHSGDIKYASGDVSDVASSAVRPLQVYDIQMSTRAESPSSSSVPARGLLTSSTKGPILVEKVEMTSSPLHDREEEVDRLLGESQSSIKLVDDVDNDPERVTDLVDFRNNSGSNKNGSSNGNFSDQNNGTMGLYEDVEVQIEPTTKIHGSTTLSMVPDLLSQCENTTHTLTHIDVKIEETVPSVHNKSIVLNIGTPDRDIVQQQQPQKTRSKSQSPQPQEPSPEPRQILPKIFAEDNKNDNKRNSSSSLSSTSKGKKSSKGFTIQGLGSANKKSEKDASNSKDFAPNPNVNGTNNHGASKAAAAATIADEQPEKETVAEGAKENKKSSKPGFFERLSKIRLSSGSKTKKQKVHPKADEIHQEADTSGAPTVISTTTNFGAPAPLRSANSFNVNGNSNKSNNSGANSSSLTTNHSGTAVQPILKKSTASSSTIPPVGPHYNGNEMGIMGDSENEPDEATQAFENILEEIAGLKSIQLRQEKNSNSSIEKSPTSQQVRSFAKRKQFYNNAGSPSPPVSPNSRSYSDLDSKLNKFKEDTSRTLDAISKSHPDLEIIEDAVKQRQKSLSPEPSKHVEPSRPLAATLPKQSSSSASEAIQNSEREWYRLLKSAAEKYSYHKGPKDEHIGRENAFSHKTGIVETDLDTGASREMLDEDMLQLDCIVPCYTVSTSEIPTSAAAASTTVSIVTSSGSPATAAKTRSLTNLSTRLPLSIAPSQFEESTGDLSDSEERAKSLEFLLDENHKSSSVPPENKLRLETRQLSEHELRIQRSLQRLNLPEWYKQHGTLSSNATSGTSSQYTSVAPNITKRSDYGSSGGLAGGWTGLSTYKAPSMSSLQSNGGRSSGTLKSNFVRGRPATMSVTRTSKESLLTTGSANHSPSAFERSSFTYGMPFTMTRFGQGRLSTHSGSVSPPSTPDSTVKTSSYVKKPYLGWRSQERLNAAAAAGVSTPGAATATGTPKLSIYLPPAERLAADLLAARAKSPHPPVRPPVSDRPPLPKAPPRSEKTVVVTKNRAELDEPIETAGAHCSSPVMSKQISSMAVVTKISNQPNDSHLSQEFSSQNPQSHKSTKVSPDVHDSIRQVTTAISHYINRGQEGQSQQKVKPKTGKKQAIWIESSFVGQKPPSK